MKLSNTYQHKWELPKLARVFRNSSNNLGKGNIKVLITQERKIVTYQTYIKSRNVGLMIWCSSLHQDPLQVEKDFFFFLSPFPIVIIRDISLANSERNRHFLKQIILVFNQHKIWRVHIDKSNIARWDGVHIYYSKWKAIMKHIRLLALLRMLLK